MIGDTRWIALLKRGDENAFRELIYRYQDQVYNVIFRMTGNAEDAEDLTQEVFIKIFRAIHTFRGQAKLSTWIYRIATNVAKNGLRDQKRRTDRLHGAQQWVLERHQQGIHRPDQILMGKELEHVIQNALQSLDKSLREVVILRDLEHLSYEDISEILNLPLGTVKSRLHRGRWQLKECIEAYFQKGSKGFCER